MFPRISSFFTPKCAYISSFFFLLSLKIFFIRRRSNTQYMTITTMLNFLFPPPPSLFVTAMSVISFVSLANAGFGEVRGKHLNYSKFWNANSNNNKNATGKKDMKLSSKTGMLLLYTPAFLAGAASFWIFPHQSFRSTILQSSVTFHFFKRLVEVTFTHISLNLSMSDSHCFIVVL